MAPGTILQHILVEEKELQFTSGFAVVNFKTGYDLANAYAIKRGTGENNTYAVANIYGRTNDTYQLQNESAGLTAKMWIRLVWVRV